jgi:hypothetical protein
VITFWKGRAPPKFSLFTQEVLELQQDTFSNAALKAKLLNGERTNLETSIEVLQSNIWYHQKWGIAAFIMMLIAAHFFWFASSLRPILALIFGCCLCQMYVITPQKAQRELQSLKDSLTKCT